MGLIGMPNGIAGIVSGTIGVSATELSVVEVHLVSLVHWVCLVRERLP